MFVPVVASINGGRAQLIVSLNTDLSFWFRHSDYWNSVSAVLLLMIWNFRLYSVAIRTIICDRIAACQFIVHSWTTFAIRSIFAFAILMPLFCLLAVMSSHDRSLRYYKKQIEKIIYAVSETLERHVDSEACLLLENAEGELAQLRSDYANEVKKFLLQCTDEEFEAKCDLLTEAQDSLFESCRLVMAKSKNEIQKFRGRKARESLTAMPVNSSMLSPQDMTMSSKHYPKIKIPTFDGTYKNFMRFKGIFVNLVHEEASIPNICKLYYLQDALTGEAAKLIEDVPITEEAYEEAWARVLSRYDNQKALVLIYFRELTSISKISKPEELRNLLNVVTNSVNNLKLCGLPADNWSDLTAYLLYKCLDDKTREDFDNSQSDSAKYFGWKALNTFLQGRAFCSETRLLTSGENSSVTQAKEAASVVGSSVSQPVTPAREVPAQAHSAPRSALFTVTRDKCVACNEHHLLIACAAFAALTPHHRFEKVTQNQLCTNCFSKSHQVKNCDSRSSCRICNQRHHTMLHFPKRSSTSPPKSAQPVSSSTAAPVTAIAPSVGQEVVPVTPSPAASGPPTTNLTQSAEQSKTVILPTAVVRVRLPSGVYVTARVLLDSCSQVNLMSESFIRKFKVPVQNKVLGHTSFTGATDGIVQVSQVCAVQLLSRVNRFSIDILADVVPANTLKYSINGVSLPKDSHQIRGFPLADPAIAEDPIHVPVPDILLGAEYFEACLLNDTRNFGKLTLRNSQFGWLLIGSVNQPASCGLLTSLPVCLTLCQLENQLRRFCEMEDVNAPLTEITDDKAKCSQHFEETHAYQTDGKFLVRLPLHSPRELLTYNYSYAYRNLVWSEKKRDELATPEYVKFTRENHLKAGYLIPHRAVFRPGSTTTQTRVVFNASSTTISGYSLNDILMVGPTIQPDLFTILLQFRQHRVAFTADISKMYRCIWVHEDDRPLQCILWREEADQPVESYQLNTLTYGTACAPFIATKCLATLAQSISSFPVAAKAIESHFYMDDLLSGADSLEECRQLQQKVHTTLAGAGFVLRKYQSNDPTLFSELDPELIGAPVRQTIIGELATSVLGVSWQPQSDTFQLRVVTPKVQTTSCTRRSLLSEISKTFDPLGFVAPFTIRAKIFMQRVWAESTTWDEPLSQSLAEDFHSYWHEIQYLESFQVPRLLVPPQNIECSSQLIGFCDASELAYCAVVYFRAVSADGNISVNFVCAKTRVAPLKTVSIPRLELQAAWLLTQLISRVSKVLNVSLANVRVFSDSKVTLAWLAKPPSTWSLFVRNRVAKIVESLPTSSWAYVKSSQNPADLGTRGLSVAKFLQSNLWLHGPPFLLIELLPSFVSEDTELEKRRNLPICALNCLFDVNFVHVLNRFSTYTRMLRVFAFISRFIANCRDKVRTRKKMKLSFLSASEIFTAEVIVIRITQMHYFRDVFHSLFQNQPLANHNQLRALHPFLDSNKLIRTGGRLGLSSLAYDQRHPLVLPSKSKFVQLLIQHLHVKFFHAQRALIANHLRFKFWCHGNLTRVIKGCLKQCIVCLRYNSVVRSQLMADLPVERVTPSRPFTSVGVDFAGPFTTKCVGHRSVVRFKAYVALFTCLATRAIHLEVVSTLSTDHFMLSFTRFIARRGRPSVVWSDNGTNFIGAAAVLQLDEERVASFSAENRIR